MQKTRVENAFVFTIFGASGDLAKLMLYPSLFQLEMQGRLPENYWIIGYSRSKFSLDKFRDIFEKSIREKYKNEWNDGYEKVLGKIKDKVFYHQGMYDEIESFESYKNFVDELTGGNYDQEMFYFSVPPVAFKPIINNLGKIRIKDEAEKVKLVIEKPFGEDYDSANELFHCIGNNFDEEQVYLLDHYLGKLTVRSVLALRQNNRIINLILNPTQISNIQVSALETLEVEERLGYYDEVGATKDMIQSHLLQLFALIGMELPVRVDTDSVALNKHFILSSTEYDKAAIGQYEGFCESKEHACSPFTDTYAACRLMVNNTDRDEVPVFIRTGKSLTRKQTSIVVEFKKYPHQTEDCISNRLEIEIAPNPSVRLVLANENGYESKLNDLVTGQSLVCEGDDCLPAHAVLFLDALTDRKMYFLSFQQILDSWRIIDAMKESLSGVKPEVYDKGSMGPKGADDLIQEAGFEWVNF